MLNEIIWNLWYYSQPFKNIYVTLLQEKNVTEHKENFEEYQRLLEEKQQQISDMETQLEMESEKVGMMAM